MNAEILCVGTELLLGDIINTNAAFIAKELAANGINVFYQSVVGDNPQRLESSLQLAFSRADVVILTGGLGPTYDDLTKETVAKLFHRKMQLHQPSYDHLLGYFEKNGKQMTPNNKKQAIMPEGAVIFENDYGTAPGLALEENGKIAILLPGPPREMQPMFLHHVIPYLYTFIDHMLVSRRIHIFGQGESSVEQTLKDLMVSSTNPTIAPYAKTGEVQLRVTASAKDKKTAYKLIDPVVEQIKQILGDCIYGIDVDTLENALVQKLLQKKLTLAVAESCTGGLVSQRITSISGCSAVYLGGVCSYSNQAKQTVLQVKEKTTAQYGAVSAQTALEMAKGIANIMGSDIGISTTGVAGPTQSEGKEIGLVYIGIYTKHEQKTLELHLSRNRDNDREYIRYLAASYALHAALKATEQF